MSMSRNGYYQQTVVTIISINITACVPHFQFPEFFSFNSHNDVRKYIEAWLLPFYK